MDTLRDRSGNVDSSNPLVAFLYLLMRDHLPAGQVEAVVQTAADAASAEFRFTNGWLATYASDLASRLEDY